MIGDRLDARMLARIAESPLTLTVVYPARSSPTASSPSAAPVSPLGPVRQQQTVVYDDPTSATRDPVTVSCLWYDRHQVGANTSYGEWRTNQIGWLTDADVLAVVAMDTILLDPDDPQGVSIFTGALRVEHLGRHYRVLDWTPIGRGFAVPKTCYVWMSGAKSQ